MSMFRMLDRMYYRCPEITREQHKDYPEVDWYTQEVAMYTPQSLFPSLIFAYAFVQVAENGEPFIDVYKCSHAGCYDARYLERFIWKKGTRLSITDEDALLKLLDDENVFFSDENLEIFAQDCKRYFTDFEIPDFWRKPYYIKFMYFTLQSGSYERLYKAGLYTIAEHISEFEDIPIGVEYSSPAKMFGMPLRLLRLLNTDWGFELLRTKEKRDMICALYDKYRDYIDLRNTWPPQIRYLYDIESGYVKRGFEKKVYKFIGKAINDDMYEDYMYYLELIEELREYYPFEKAFANEEDYLARYEQALHVRDMIENEEEINRRLAMVRSENAELLYSDDQYIVDIFTSVKAITNEAGALKECLINYVEKSAYGPSVLLSMRRADAPEESLLTAEYICEERFILEIRGVQNRNPSAKEMKWFVHYCKRKNIKFSKRYSMYSLVDPDMLYTENERKYEFNDAGYN